MQQDYGKRRSPISRKLSLLLLALNSFFHPYKFLTTDVGFKFNSAATLSRIWPGRDLTVVTRFGKGNWNVLEKDQNCVVCRSCACQGALVAVKVVHCTVRWACCFKDMRKWYSIVASHFYDPFS